MNERNNRANQSSGIDERIDMKNMSSRYRSAILMILSVLCLVAPAQAIDTEAYIHDWITTTYDLNPERTTIETVHNSLKTRLVNPDDVTIKPLSERQPRGPFTVLVTIEDQSGLIERGQVRLRVHHYAEVLVAKGDIDRHALVSADEFEKQMMDITSLREQPVISVDQLPGQRATTNIRPGAVLTVACIEPVPDIEVGGEVTIVFNSGQCTITAPGKSLQTGWRGDQVRVRNLVSGKIIAARVVDNQSVTVNPE